MTKTEFDKTAAPAELAREPAELTEAELSQVQAGALPPIRGPKQPIDG